MCSLPGSSEAAGARLVSLPLVACEGLCVAGPWLLSASAERPLLRLEAAGLHSIFGIPMPCMVSRKVRAVYTWLSRTGDSNAHYHFRTGQDYGDNLYRFAMLSLCALEAVGTCWMVPGTRRAGESERERERERGPTAKSGVGNEGGEALNRIGHTTVTTVRMLLTCWGAQIGNISCGRALAKGPDTLELVTST